MTSDQILEKINVIEKRALDTVKDSFPLDLGKHIVEVEKLQINRPKLFDYNNEINLKDNGDTLKGSIKGVLIVKDKENDRVIEKSALRDLVTLPYLTNRGTYIVGGLEKVIAKQMLLKPGVYTYDKDSTVESLMFLQKGKNIYLRFEPENLNLNVDIDNRTMNAITFFRILGISDTDITQAIDDTKIAEQLFSKAGSKKLDAETQKLWTRLEPSFRYYSSSGGRYPGREKATEDIRNYFFNNSSFGETGSKVMEITLGYSSTNPDSQVFLKALNKIIKIAKADTEDKKYEFSDDKDDIRFQNVLADEDHISYLIASGIEELAREMTNKLKTSPDRNILGMYTSNKASSPLNSFMVKGSTAPGKGSLVDMVEQTNPLLMSAAQRKVTSLGEGGLTTHSASQGTRNLQNSTFGKLDPVETPESGKIGLVSHFTRSSSVKDLTIRSKYYKVSNGAFTRVDRNIVELEPLEEHNKYIAFYDPNTFSTAGNRVNLPNEVWVRHQGNIIKVAKGKVDLVDVSPHAIWGDATALIPFNAHNDGNRMLMGANMQKQALILTNREAPLVQNAVDDTRTKTYEEAIADEQAFLVRTDVGGTVTKVTDDEIVVKTNDDKEQAYRLMNYFPLNVSNYIKNEPLVNVGDNVKKGQLLAEGWQTKDGKLALGMNARMAYMPWKGYNFEDGYVISESFAQRMVTEELKEIVVDIDPGQIGGPNSGIKDILAQLNVSRIELDKLDENGVIKVGEEVGPNTVLVGIAEEDTSLDDLPEYKVLRALGTKIQKQYVSRSEVITGYISGKVIRVKLIPRGSGAYSVKITVLMRNSLKEGDKLAGRHGNKGIITKIERDEDMPRAEDGEPIDVIYSPLGVPSRKNLGQLYEANAGLIASKKGAPFKVYNFDKSEADKVSDGLKEIGFPDGKMTLFDPETGKPYENKATVGVVYMLKLHHKVDEKLQARNIGKINYIYNSPVKSVGERAGEKENPQKLGEMEMRALAAAKAVNFMDEATHLKSDGAGDSAKRRKIFDALAFSGLSSIDRTAPESMHIFKNYTSAMGLNVKPMYNGREVKSLDNHFNSLAITPLRKEEVHKLSRGEVTEAAVKTSYVAGEKADKGGLFDPDIFGEEDDRQANRTYWGHIDLAMPLPNPVLLKSNVNPYSALLDMNSSKIESIMTGGFAVITNPGNSGLGKYELIELNKAEELEDEGINFEYEVGGKALEKMLQGINISAEIKITEEALAAAAPKDRAKHYKKLRILRMLEENKMKPDDLLVKSLPVLPVGLRPVSKSEGNRIVVDDMNFLYKNLIQVNNKLKDISDPQKWYVTEPTVKTSLTKDAYNYLENIMGVNTKPITVGGKAMEGIVENIKGKEGLIRGRLMSKFVDYSGRSVITVNPSLNLDEAGIPIDMATKLYQPFVARELFITQKVRTQEQAIEKSSDPNDPDTVKALEKIVAERPIILNRAPTLHKYSIQAFTPKLTKARAIEINPLVVTGFNADFDGDQMGVHIPLTQEAVAEAKTLLTPSQNLINPTNGSLIAPVKGEAILGIYYLTVDKYKGKQITKNMAKKTYTSYDQLLQEYKNSEVNTYDIVLLDNVPATVGQHLVNSVLPEQYRDYRKVINGSLLSEMIETMLREDTGKDKKTGGVQTAVVALNKLKDLGFLASTKSALSISVADLKDIKDKDKLLADAEERVAKNPGELVAAYFDVDTALQEKVENSLGQSNPMTAFIASGAKGNKKQTARMVGMVGWSEDITGSIRKEMPITSSFKQGLSPQEMWIHAYDSRRGLADRALSTAEPGALTRSIWSSTQDAIITITDCNDTQGMYLQIKDSSLVGRFLAQPVRDKSGIIVAERGKLVDVSLKDKLQNIEGLTGVYVRSPLTCKAPKGICQKCYGNMPGTNTMPMVGEPVGILASQAIGEPTAQGVMKTFHGGGATRKDTPSGFDRVKELFNISSSPKNKSVLSPVNGRVLSVTKDIVNIVITIEHYEDNGKRKLRNIKVPLTKEVLVKAGDNVTMGQKLTEEYGTLDPNEILRYKGLDEAQGYLVSELSSALRENNINRKHIELAVGKLTDKVEIGSNSTSDWLPGQVVPRNQVERWNEMNAGRKQTVDINDTLKLLGSKAARNYKGFSGELIVAEGEEITQDKLGKLLALRHKKIEVYPGKIEYNPVMFGVITNPTKGNENWFSQLGHQNIKEPLAEGAAFGKVDLLEDPRSRQMAGKLVNVGSGYNKWKEEFDKLKDKIGGTIAGLFD